MAVMVMMISIHDDCGGDKKLTLDQKKKNKKDKSLLFQFPPSKHYWQKYFLSIYPQPFEDYDHEEKRIMMKVQFSPLSVSWFTLKRIHHQSFSKRPDQ